MRRYVSVNTRNSIGNKRKATTEGDEDVQDDKVNNTVQHDEIEHTVMSMNQGLVNLHCVIYSYK